MARKNFKTLSEKVRSDPERSERVDQYKRAIEASLDLAQARERRGETQVGLARMLGTSQANVSRIERQDDVYLSTLAGYVAARYTEEPPSGCLAFGVACGAESTQHFGAGTVDRNQVERLLGEVAVHDLEVPAEV